jgi:mannose-1-phosphate guanylyltransferase
MKHFYALLMAGGRGSRLWPVSRPDRPKPLLSLTEKRSLYQITAERMQSLFPAEQTYVVTQRDLKNPLMQAVPGIPAQNYVCEPCSRDTAPAMGLGIFSIAQHDPDAIIAILPSDHIIEQTDAFFEALRAAYAVAQQGSIVVLGIRPTDPATEYGYIEQGALLCEVNGINVYQAQRFVEKPNRATAEQFMTTGRYSWDAGLVIASAQTLIREFERQQPAMAETLKAIAVSHSSIDELWATLESISFDYAIMEHAEQIAVIPVDMGWQDIGSWAAIYKTLPKDAQGNASVTPGQSILINSHRSLIWSERLVVTLGIEDLIIIDTPDALLICKRDHAQQICYFGSTQ